jgi:hypothetical protein
VKIKAPVNSLADVKALAPHGIDCVYTGIDFLHDEEPFHTNRQENCGIRSSAKLQELVDYAHRNKIRVEITLNNYYYTADAALKIVELVRKLEQIGVDGIIAADCSVLHLLRCEGTKLPLTASVLLSVMNSAAVDFCLSLGIRKIVFAYHVAAAEILRVVQNRPHVDFEVLGMNYGCFYEDGMCGFIHDRESVLKNPGPFTEWIRWAKPAVFHTVHSLPHNLRHELLRRGLKIPPCSIRKNDFTEVFADTPASAVERSFSIKTALRERDAAVFFERCALCFLKRFSEAGVRTLKIAGRNLPRHRKVRDAALAAAAIRAIRDSRNEADYRDRAAALFRKYRGFDCKGRFCYYVDAL